MKYADVEVRKELTVLYHILHEKGIIDEQDLMNMHEGKSVFKDKELKK